MSDAAHPMISETEIDAVLAEFDGDPRAAIAALLHDLKVLAEDLETTVSRGFVRGAVKRVEIGRKTG
jgi:predicted HD phosphohydrolase